MANTIDTIQVNGKAYKIAQIDTTNTAGATTTTSAARPVVIKTGSVGSSYASTFVNANFEYSGQVLKAIKEAETYIALNGKQLRISAEGPNTERGQVEQYVYFNPAGQSGSNRPYIGFRADIANGQQALAIYEDSVTVRNTLNVSSANITSDASISALTLDGRRIYISSTAPSSPSKGDIWVDIS